MAINIPYINPVRIRNLDKAIDYDNYLPRFDSQTAQVQYQKGVNPAPVTANFLINKTLEVIVYSSAGISEYYMHLPNGTMQSMSILDITPSGWTASERIYKLYYTPSIEGVHYFTFYITAPDLDDHFQSDDILVMSGTTDKDLIEIEYEDVENRYGGFWYDGSTRVWNPRMYYTGIKRKIPSPREEKVFIDEPGNPITLQVTSSKSQEITLTDIHETYIDSIEEVIKVDVTLNGQLVSISDFSSDKKDANSDVVDIKIIATRADNDGFFNYS